MYYKNKAHYRRDYKIIDFDCSFIIDDTAPHKYNREELARLLANDFSGWVALLVDDLRGTTYRHYANGRLHFAYGPADLWVVPNSTDTADEIASEEYWFEGVLYNEDDYWGAAIAHHKDPQYMAPRRQKFYWEKIYPLVKGGPHESAVAALILGSKE